LPNSESAVSRVYFVCRVESWRTEEIIILEDRATNIVAKKAKTPRPPS